MKKNLYSFFSLFFLLCITVISVAQPAGYQYVRQIVIQESQIPDGTNLNNFPFLLKMTNANFRSTANGGHVSSSSGYDIVFYLNSCNTLLDHQLDYYDPLTGEIAIWIRIPILSTTADTRLYMYYGNNSVSSSTSVATTWDAGYSGIWHLGDNPGASAPQIPDATANGHNGTAYGSMTAANVVNGKIGKSLSFDEVNDHIRIPDFLYGQELTVSFWFNTSEVNGNSYQYLFSHGVWATQNSLNIYAGEDNITIPSEIQNRFMLKTVFRDNNDANNFDTLDAGNTWMNSGWHYYTMRIQDFGGATIYIDGSQVAVYSVWGANTFNPATDIFLAGREDLNAGRFFGGLLDEVRISSVWRTSNWIRTEYNNQSDPSSFFTSGIEGSAISFCFPLPIVLSDFTAARSGNVVKLQWNTDQADHTDHVTIERSADGNEWQAIGVSYNGHAFTDSSATSNALFYRIKLYSDLKVYTSPVRKVGAACCESGIRVYPNPSPQGRFYIDLPGAETPEHFLLFDVSGVLIKDFTIEKKYDRTYMLKMTGNTKRGIYLLQVRFSSGNQAKMLIL